MLEEPPNDERELSLVGHLTELRARIIICLIAIVVITLVVFPFANRALALLIEPIRSIKVEPTRPQVVRIDIAPDGALKLGNPEILKNLNSLSSRQIQFHVEGDPALKQAPGDFFVGESPTQPVVYSSPVDPIMLQLKITVILSITLGLPFLLWQIWLFVKPGLRAREQAFIKPVLSGAVLLFPMGAAFAFVLFKYLLLIFIRYTIPGLMPLYNIHEYLSLMLALMLVCGLLFEIPLVIAMGARVGVVTPAFLKRFRRPAYVVLAFVAMIFTPADPFSMILMFLMLMALFEVSVGVSIPMARLHQRDAQADLPSNEAAS